MSISLYRNMHVCVAILLDINKGLKILLQHTNCIIAKVEHREGISFFQMENIAHEFC